MTRDATAGVGRWRQGRASRPAAPKGPTATSKWTEAAFLAALLLSALAIAVWILFQFVFNTGPKPFFVPFWVAAYEKPGIPPIGWLDADRTALRDSGVFPTVDTVEEQTRNPTLEVMKTRLEHLPDRKRDESVVVYLAGRAVVDHDGKIQVLASDSRPYEPGTQLPLSLVLDRLKACPVKNKLLILDIMRGMVDPRDIGGTTDGVGDLVVKELQSVSDAQQLNDPNLLVLTACSPGEAALSSESLGHSVFGYYLNRALATTEADGNGDRLVSVRELADYLARNVDAWSLHYRGVHQRPKLLGPQGRDFFLAAVKAGKSPPAAAPQGKGAEKTRAGVGDKSKAKESAAEKGQEPAADKAAEPEGEGDSYPRWLADGWLTLERWRITNEVQAAPRVYRRLGRRLILAEARWRGGDPPEPVRSDLERDVNELAAAMEQAKKIPRPGIRSVGQARALLGWQPDPALTATLSGLLKQRRAAGDTPELAKAVTAALAPLKDKTSLDLAGALLVAAADEVLDGPTLAFLDGLVEQSKLPRDLIELRFLHRLALRAARSAPGEWRTETARDAWNTVLAAEQAKNQPQVLAWVRDRLDQADASLHEAQILLLPEAAGFASWTQIHAAWSDAKEKYQVVVDRQRAVRDGQAVLARTLEALVCLIPYLEATHQPQLQSDWLEAAETAGMLARLLEPPRPKEPPVEGLGSRLHEATRQLERLHRNLLRAFQHDQVEVLVRQCRSEAVAPEPGLAAQIDALLTTPLLAAQDRPALWAAHRLLERRLQQRPPRGDSEAANPAEAPRDRARRRFDRMAAFLKLAGDEKNARRLSDFREILVQASELTQSTGADIALNMSDPARAWAAMARCAELAYFLFEQRLSHGDRDDAYDRVGWLAPVYVAGFDDWAANPLRQIREQDALTAATWLANHYRYWSLDLHEWIDPDNFLEAAARECPTKGPSPPEIYPRIDVPAVKPSLSPKVPSVTVALPILLAGADAQSPQKVILSAEKPDDRRLTVTVSEPIAPEIGTESPTPANLTVTWTDEAIRGAAPPPAGFLVRARMPDNLTYHALVPLAIVASGTYPGLALSSDPVQSDDLPMDDLRLRPMAGKRQPFFVFVKNPSSKLWKVIVEVWEGDKLAAWSGTNEKPLEVPANSSRVVPAFATAAPKAGEPPPKPDAPLPRLAGPLRLRLRDVAGTIVDEQPIRPAIAAPREYIEVRKAQFTPAALGQPNRLTVELQALPQMTGPPCPVDLVLPMDKELFPTLLAPPKDGTLTGTLEVGKPPVILFAEKIPLSPGADAEGSFYVNVDGVKRALWFRSRFPEAGGPQRTIEPRGPRVRFHPVRLVESGKPARLRVEFEVDNAPPDARLAFRLGRFEDGQFKDDLERWSDTAQRRQIGFDPKGEGGALLFEASVEDWVREWLVPNLLGRRTLRAQLLDARGRRVLDSHELELVLDDRKPRDMAIDVPDRIEKGTKTLTVKATVTPPASRIKEVAFIFGKEAEFDKAVAEDKAFKGQPADLDGRTWTATLPVPKDATRELIITARFKTGVDLTAFAPPGVVAVIEPAREDEKTAKPAPSKPGAIEGIVTEADRPQPNLVVYLNDPTIPNDKPGAWKAANTDSKGTFSFKDLEPKRYRLYCAKNDGITNRVADKPNVMVESGQTVKVTLELVK